jgi:hypothetical protein
MLITESIQQWTKRNSHSLSLKLFVIFVSSGNTHSLRTNAIYQIDIFVGFFQHNDHTHGIVPKICSKYSIVSLFIAFQKQSWKLHKSAQICSKYQSYPKVTRLGGKNGQFQHNRASNV